MVKNKERPTNNYYLTTITKRTLSINDQAIFKQFGGILKIMKPVSFRVRSQLSVNNNFLSVTMMKEILIFNIPID